MAHSRQIKKYCLSFLAFKAENTLTTENIGDMSHLHIYVWTCTRVNTPNRHFSKN